MKGLTPEFVLKTREVQRHDALCTMLENYGFKIRPTKSSHFVARHTDDRCSDIICGLVIGTKDVVYQRIAAKACLEAKERLERMSNAQSQAEHNLTLKTICRNKNYLTTYRSHDRKIKLSCA